MNIDSKVLDVLSNATIEGNTLKLTGQLERPLYVAVNKVLEAAGGKWNRKAQAHVFEEDAADLMDQIILTGKVQNKKQELGDFPTPPDVVKRLMQVAQIEAGMLVLEPSAGVGAIAVPVALLGAIVHCFEIDKSKSDKLATRLFATAPVYSVRPSTDFLQVEKPNLSGDLYDRVVMNPPFARQADIKHVMHALRFLSPGGRLVAIMAAGVTFRTDRLTTHFRAIPRMTMEALPEDSFKESGTNINTVLVTIDKE